jgi:hypothetical protein
MNEETVVRDPYRVDESGTITCFGPVPEAEFVHVLGGDAESLVDAADEATAAALDGGPGRADRDGTAAERAGSLVLFDCVSRVLYLGEAFERELDTVGGDDQPAVGALTIGEIANDKSGHLEYYNKTAVVASLTDE